MKYNKKGQPIDVGQKVFAEHIDGVKQKVYYVLTYNNIIYDPLGPDSNRESSLRTELKKTNEDSFFAYLSYLQSNNRIYMTKAQRSYLNG